MRMQKKKKLQLKKLPKCKEEIDKKLVQVKVRMMLMLLHGTIKRRDN